MNRRAFLSAAAASSLVSASARAQVPPPRLQRFGAAAAYSAQHRGAAFLVARNGIVLTEDYPGGDIGARWPIGAGARAFSSLLAGSLIADGLMSLDEPVALTLGDWGFHPVKSQISVRALLNGTSGIAFGDHGGGDIGAAIVLEPTAGLGERFIDDSAPYILLTEIAHRKLEMAGRASDPAHYLTERTLAPIGCAPIGWTRGRDSAPLFHDGIAVTARGWAQAGELIRREGVWRAQQLVDENALREAVRGTFAEARAGMGLWLAAPGRGGRDPAGIDSDLWRGASPAPFDLAMAAGAGGQRLYIIPSTRMVIVRQSQTLDPRADWSDAEFLSLLLRDLEA